MKYAIGALGAIAGMVAIVTFSWAISHLDTQMLSVGLVLGMGGGIGWAVATHYHQKRQQAKNVAKNVAKRLHPISRDIA